MSLDTVEEDEEVLGVDSPEEQATSTGSNSPATNSWSFTYWVSLTPGPAVPNTHSQNSEKMLRLKFRKGQETAMGGRNSTDTRGSGKSLDKAGRKIREVGKFNSKALAIKNWTPEH
jgi:hypothetical protein